MSTASQRSVLVSRRKAAGRCVDCAAKNPIPAHARCPECRDREAVRMMRHREIARSQEAAEARRRGGLAGSAKRTAMLKLERLAEAPRRCRKCWLILPCGGCVPGIESFAQQRRGVEW